MDKEEKNKEEMPEDPVEEKPTGEEKIQDKAEEAVEKYKEEKPKETKEEIKETSEEDTEPAEEKEPSKDKETSKEPKKEEKPKKKEGKAEKPAEAKQKDKKDKKKKAEHDDDFKYIVRIADTDIDGDKKIIHGLTSIKGIGRHMSVLIAEHVDIDVNKKLGDLSDAQIENIKKTIEEVIQKAPAWMLNHRKDYETGKDLHLIGPEIDMKLRDEINIMKKIRCYRGIRHERGLPVRGQRTRANNRKGLTLGVSKKRP